MAERPKIERYRVRNWEQFQHYKNRNPPWIKLHFAMLASEDWVSLDDASRLLAVVCMLIASRNEGFVPNNPAYLKRVAYLNAVPDFGPLISCGFLENPLAGASNAQAEDSKKKQAQADARPEERRGETEESQRREESPSGRDAPQDDFSEKAVFTLGKSVLGKSAGGVITKLIRHHDGNLQAAYTHLEQAKAKENPMEWVQAAMRPKHWRDQPEYAGIIVEGDER